MSAHAVAATAIAAASALVPHTATHSRHFDPRSISAIGSNDWWVAGEHSVAHTTDGGAHFTYTSLPRHRVADHDDDEVTFANANDGYLDGRRLFVTHDGGAIWQRRHVGGHVTSLVTADGYAYATVGGRVHHTIERSTVGSDDWSRLAVPGHGASIEWADSSRVFGVTNVRERRHEGSQRLIVSRDHGATWRVHHLPIEDLACTVEQVRAPVLWEHCATGMLSSVWRSHDNGKHFRVPDKKEGGSALPNAAAFGAASNRVGVIGYQDLRRTTNAGRTWHQVGPKPHRNRTWETVSFSDHEHGFAIRETAHHSQLWQTDDAGADWHRVALPAT
jgi:photosystem II stability/assembly factor-like uncharacterized protein